MGVSCKIHSLNTSNTSNLFHSLSTYLSRRVHPASLGMFRILFGLVMFMQTVWFIATDFVQKNISEPIIHFKYYYFQFLEPLSPLGMQILMWMMLLASALIVIGILYRASVFVFLMSFTYLWLLDKGFFNNHYYLITLLSLLLLFIKGDSWGVLKWKERNKTNKKKSIYYISQWQIFLLKAQISIVFLVAGINKLNPYWLSHFQPMDYILDAKADISGLAFLRSTGMAIFFTYGGLIIDLVAVFLLWWKRTRVIGIITLVGFNFLNFWLFWNIGEIGIFPFLLLATIVLFLEPDTPAKWFKSHSSSTVHRSPSTASTRPPTVHRLSFAVLACYLVFQLLFPFRHLLYPGHVDWTGEGQRFAWRMKTMLKEADIQFFIKDNDGGKYPVEVSKMLSPKQYNNLIYYPDFIPPIARRLKEEALKQGIPEPEVVADFKVKFMGVHPSQPIVAPETDLSRVRVSAIRHSDWILPLKTKTIDK